jgi:diguanylate cyclase (GGDEF)-like protein/PAS domain S-box-containing protein
MEKVYGWTKAEALGSISHELLQTEFPEALQVVRSKVLREGRWEGELMHRRKNGQTLFVASLWVLHRDRNGAPAAILEMNTDISARKQAEEEIRNLAFYDALTKLPNRRLLLDRFSVIISACKRSNRYAALMFIDLDNFKPLNDEHGHDVGDILLVEVAHRIYSCVREVDTVSRFGGDEFVVILSDLDTDRAVSLQRAGIVAEKIRQVLGEPYRLAVLKEGGVEPRIVEHRCTASIGVALFNDHGTSQDALLRLADSAMYQAKSAGRNRVYFAGA